MSNELILYTHPMSRGRTVRWVLEEIGRPYRTELLEYGTTMKSAEYLAINPMGKVPALKHGDMVITESAAICAYLADAFPQAGLAPALNDPKRGLYYKWLFFMAGPLEAGMINQAMGVSVTQEQKKMVGYVGVDEMLGMLEATLSENTYLLGETFSVADIYIGAFLAWMMHAKMIKPQAVFERYVERLYARPAAIRASQIDDALLAEQK